MPRIKRLKPFAMTEGRTVADARATQDEQDGQPSSMKQFSRHLRPKPPAGVSAFHLLNRLLRMYICTVYDNTTLKVCLYK